MTAFSSEEIPAAQSYPEVMESLTNLVETGAVSKNLIEAIEAGRLILDPGRTYNLVLKGADLTRDSRFHEPVARVLALLKEELGIPGHIDSDQKLPQVLSRSSSHQRKDSTLSLSNVRLSRAEEDRIAAMLETTVKDSVSHGTGRPTERHRPEHIRQELETAEAEVAQAVARAAEIKKRLAVAEAQ